MLHVDPGWLLALIVSHNRLNLFCQTEASSSSDVIGSGTETTIGMGIQTANPTASGCILSLNSIV